jgi:hypothetical protein
MDRNSNKYLTRSRDVDTYLLDQLSDKELFEVMLLNKEFLKSATYFFEKRLKEKYPLLVKFKPRKMNFTKYYLSVVYYISKLKEEYNIDYVPAPSLNPKTYYYRLGYEYAFPDEIDLYIGETGNLTLIKEHEDVIDRQNLIQGVIKSGNLEILKYLESKGPVFDHPSDIINAMLSKNEEMEEYVLISLLKLFDKNDIQIELVYGAAELGDLNLVKYYDNLLEPNERFQQILGHISNLDVFKYFLKKLRIGEEHEEVGEEEILQEIHDSAYYGVVYNRLDIIEYLLKEFPNIRETVAEYAHLFHNDDVIDLL